MTSYAVSDYPVFHCASCGRGDDERGMSFLTVKGGPGHRDHRLRLCHGNRDGVKADPDCYDLVVAGQIELDSYGYPKKLQVIGTEEAS